MRLATLVNFLLTRISLHTGLQFRAYMRGIGQTTGLFFFSSTKETVFSLWCGKCFGGFTLTFAGNKFGSQILGNLV